jgi:S-adenosylmethionine decarboxylase
VRPRLRGGLIKRTLPGLDIVLGTEWIVDAHGCDPSALRSPVALERLFALVVEELGLHPVAEPLWHVFPGEGGITGLLLLTESHLACHTFPERAFAAFDLYSCRPSQEWPWAERLAEAVGACDVRVRSVRRGELPADRGEYDAVTEQH